MSVPRIQEIAERLCRSVPLSALHCVRVGDCTLSLTDDNEERTGLLARLAAGERIELDIEMVAFRQLTGEMNRNFIRFQDDQLGELATSFANKPLLIDHRQRDSTKRIGTVLSAVMVAIDGGVEFRMTARVAKL